MNNDFFEAIEMLEREKGIPTDFIFEKIKNALAIVVKKKYETTDECVVINFDKIRKKFTVVIRKLVVAEVTDPQTQITLEEALKISKRAKIDKYVDKRVETNKEFGYIYAQTAKHVIRQGIRDGENTRLFEELQNKQHEIVTATVNKIDPKKGNVTIEIGKSEAVLHKSEQIPGEILGEGDKIKVYIADVQSTEKGPKVMISRSDPGLVKRLFELEVPEIFEGIVEIKSISREAGSRTKIAVAAKDGNIDPVGSCIGKKRMRISKILSELSGEKIDIVKYNEDPKLYIAAALSPAAISEVTLIEPHCCRAYVPDSQLSLAIGNKGQNVRLAARLTGFKIDIKPESFIGTPEYYKTLEDDEQRKIIAAELAENPPPPQSQQENIGSDKAEKLSEDNSDQNDNQFQQTQQKKEESAKGKRTKVSQTKDEKINVPAKPVKTPKFTFSENGDKINDRKTIAVSKELADLVKEIESGPKITVLEVSKAFVDLLENMDDLPDDDVDSEDTLPKSNENMSPKQQEEGLSK